MEITVEYNFINFKILFTPIGISPSGVRGPI